MNGIYLTIGLKVAEKSRLCIEEVHFLILKIYLLPTIFLWVGARKRVHVLFLTRASNSNCIEDFHSGSKRAT